ncbi:hypothetical protein CA85_36490 [Allorhodopirellula solitaria]|uniref:Uncharacterized protein n=1 Tax=Allorhodopirellula solitaria TaxID=2527987 RepID=A0A5C5XPR4_9BACT|nr:hypothetical protein CA85_36490 [Allorhodopirellula solitaria]
MDVKGIVGSLTQAIADSEIQSRSFSLARSVEALNRSATC